ncbi:MAG: hypothetical protein PHX05_00070 [Acidobacteriota bacterium]|nr:hypothetical protein [Acidobacteriota bacterium]
MYEKIVMVARQILLIVGGGLVANGKITEGELESVVGALLIIGAAVWRYIESARKPAPAK